MRLLETHFNAANNKYIDITSKYVSNARISTSTIRLSFFVFRLKPLEQQSIFFAKKAEDMEQERDDYAQRADEMHRQYLSAKRELDETLKSLEAM